MKKRAKWMLLIAALCAAVVFALVYTRPQTLAKRFPMLDFDSCTAIQGHFYQYGKTSELVHVAIQPEDAHFDELVAMLTTPTYKTSLANLLPRGSVTYTPVSDGDFYWTLYFNFDNVTFPDGSTGSGSILFVDNRLGELRLDLAGRDNRYIQCTTEGQADLVQNVLDIMALYPES